MIVVRNAAPGDLGAIYDLASRIGPGMTTLKADRDALGRRLEIAAASFAGTATCEECDYLFVLEDTANGRIGGVCAIKRAIGLDEPFYNYRIGTLVHASSEAGIFAQMQALYLSYDMTGSAELCSLYLHPDYRNGVNGKLLSKCRFLFMAQFPQLFPEKVFAEMRGYQKPDGSAPFWESLGRHFFRMDFDAADDLCGQGQKSFIAQLMPRHPLYTDFLSDEARAAIGRTHDDTVPARRLLEQEGLRYDGYIDIFDGGPVLQARVGELRASRESKLATLAAPTTPTTPTTPTAPTAPAAPAAASAAAADARAATTAAVATATTTAGAAAAAPAAPMTLVSTTVLDAFRVLVMPAEPQDGRLFLPAAAHAALGQSAGASVRTMPLASQPNSNQRRGE